MRPHWPRIAALALLVVLWLAIILAARKCAWVS